MKLTSRQLYSNRIRPFMEKDVIKVLAGQSRVGKSCILRQIAGEIHQEQPDANIVFINMEFQEYRSQEITGVALILFNKLYVLLLAAGICRLHVPRQTYTAWAAWLYSCRLLHETCRQHGNMSSPAMQYVASCRLICRLLQCEMPPFAT